LYCALAEHPQLAAHAISLKHLLRAPRIADGSGRRRIGPIGSEDPSRRVVQFEGEYRVEVGATGRVPDRHGDLDAAPEVAGSPVR
jgi:hypothetical protein